MRVTIVNHVASEIAASPDLVWDAIIEEYVEAKKFRELGYTIDSLDDLAGSEGGHRMRLQKDGVLIDDRICRITELDRSERRLSMVGESQSAERLLVYVTYHAAPSPTGTCYAIDCHSSMNIEVTEASSIADARTRVHELTEQFEMALSGYLAALKERLEASASTQVAVR